MTWYSVVRWKWSCNFSDYNPILFLNIRSSETRQACELEPIVSNPSPLMPSTRFELSFMKNKVKRWEITRKVRRENGQINVQSRMAIAMAGLADPAAKRVRLVSHR